MPIHAPTNMYMYMHVHVHTQLTFCKSYLPTNSCLLRSREGNALYREREGGQGKNIDQLPREQLTIIVGTCI